MAQLPQPGSASQHQEEPRPAIARILRLPELAHALQCYLQSSHLAAACLVCRDWRETWTPFLWKTLSLTQPHPIFRSHPRRSSTLETSSSPSTTTAATLTSSSSFSSDPYQDERYVLSEECLSRYGHCVRRLTASWLTSQAVLRLATHCIHLQQVKLAETPIPNKVLQSMLKALVGLRMLKLDLPLVEFADEDEDSEDRERQEGDQQWTWQEQKDRSPTGSTMTTSTTATTSIPDPDENTLLRIIDTCASPRLAHLELIFQTSVRIPVKGLCSLLRNHPVLRTIKLVDADVEETLVRKSKKRLQGGRGQQQRRNRQTESDMTRSSVPPLTLASASASSSSSPLSSTPGMVSEDDGNSVALTIPLISQTPSPAVPAPNVLQDSFALRFLSITSSHTSNNTLSYILERCPQLEALHLHSCDMLTDIALELILQHLPNLSSISLSSCKLFTSEGIDHFFKTTPQLLEHVHICDLPALHDGTMQILAGRHAYSLRKLALYYCAYVTDSGIKAILSSCRELRVFGLQAYGMTSAIFEEPWACQKTLEQLDLQGVFKHVVALDTPSGMTGAAGNRGDGGSTVSNGTNHANVGEFSATKLWRDRQARIEAFRTTRRRLMTLSRLKNLRLFAGGIGKQVLEGFGKEQRIEVLHLYGLQSTYVDELPWAEIRTQYPYLNQVYCGTTTKGIKEELARLNVELLTSSTIPDLAFENNFDDP
ncbi:hypothetical protein BGZ98_007130 [Dissophora globulifera]|nr:hypothetical protein BGZ98_007130 [Dissophora globulifera]